MPAVAAWVSLEDVVAAVGKAYNCPKNQLLRRHNRGCEARQALLYLAATHCRGRYTLAELGRQLGPVSLAAVSNARLIFYSLKFEVLIINNL